MNGRDRKNSIKALFGEALSPVPSSPTIHVAAPETKSELPAVNLPENATAAPARSTSGAVKAMGLSLTSITRDVEEARELRRAMEEGDRVIALDTARIVDSFVSDRLSQEERDDPDFAALVESIRDSGQQTPILVRPHPERPGGYQVAYGHRRLKAVRRLGKPVKAIVRQLSDAELVIAQGKENAERRNLSFIERAVFAKALVDHGFDRKVAGDALSVQKSELSRLLQVAEAIPDMVIHAVGPSPKAGRDRWMALAGLFINDAARAKAIDEIRFDRFAAASTDERFQLLFDRLSRAKVKEKPAAEDIRAPDGNVFARLNRRGRALKIEFASTADPAFVAEISETLEKAYARFVGKTAG